MNSGKDKIEELVFEMYQSGESREEILKSLIYTFANLSTMERDYELRITARELLDAVKKVIV